MSVRPGAITAVGVFYIIFGLISFITLGGIASITGSELIYLFLTLSSGLLSFISGIILMQMKKKCSDIGNYSGILLVINFSV